VLVRQSRWLDQALGVRRIASHSAVLVLATIPSGPILTLFLYAVAARVKLGFWPSYDQPDPKDLNWPVVYDCVGFVLVVGFGLALIAVAASLSWSLVDWRKGHGRWLFRLWPVVTFAGLLAWFWFDPGGLLEWYAD
jgi:hypothetical protein